MRLVLVSVLALLVSDPARADELELRTGELAQALDARVGAALHRSAEGAAERASAALEAREAERLDRAARAEALRIERRLARSQPRGEWRGRVEAELARAR